MMDENLIYWDFPWGRMPIGREDCGRIYWFPCAPREAVEVLS